MDSLTLKRHNSFQRKNNAEATHPFGSRPLIFKLQEKVLKFNDISPKTDLKTNFLGSEIEVLRTSVLFSRTFLSKYLTLIYLLTYLFQKYLLKDHNCKFKIETSRNNIKRIKHSCKFEIDKLV